MNRYYLAAAAAWVCITLQACQELASRDQFPTSDAPQQTEAGRNSYQFPPPNQYRSLPD